jgi:hypothetical protein
LGDVHDGEQPLNDLLVPLIRLPGAGQQVFHVASRAIDQLAVGGRDPGHQVVPVASEASHHHGGVNVQHLLEQQMLKQLRKTVRRKIVSQPAELKPDAGGRLSNAEFVVCLVRDPSSSSFQGVDAEIELVQVIRRRSWVDLRPLE